METDILLVHVIKNISYQNIKCYFAWQCLSVLSWSDNRHVAVLVKRAHQWVLLPVGWFHLSLKYEHVVIQSDHKAININFCKFCNL
jgi:hypothetical protein